MKTPHPGGSATGSSPAHCGAESRLQPKSRIGRYILESPLGQGAMGTVWAARDTELGRRVAIKVLRQSYARHADARARFMREARAQAALSDPNVVPIFEVGESEGWPYIVMEQIVGATLRDWMAELRSPREIVDVFIGAGKGLAAAHRAGLVHRDFKPANVIISADGRARVLDFGLARDAHGTFSASSSLTQGDHSSARQGETITATGLVVGTPAYMAPECATGKAAGPAADQFSFCVALYEALYGRRPFSGRSMAALRASILRTRLPRAPPRRGIPTSVHRVVLRGLARDPDARWRSMDALVEALVKPRRIRRGRVFTAAGLGVALTAAAIAQANEDEHPCARLLGVDTVWTEDARARSAEAFEAQHGAASWRRTEARLDRYAQAWRAERDRTCSTNDADSLSRDASIRCLARERHRVRGLLEGFSRADARVVSRAADVIDGLAQPRACRDASARVAHPEMDTQRRAVHDELDRAEALLAVGVFHLSAAACAALEERARAFGRPPTLARVRLCQGTALRELEQWDAAGRLLEDAYAIAVGGDDEAIALRATRELAAVAEELERFDEALDWVRHGRALAARSSDDPRARYLLLADEAGIRHAVSDTQGASMLYAEALEIAEEHDADSSRMAMLLLDIARLEEELGRLTEAEGLLTRALELEESRLGSEHLNVVVIRSNLCSLAVRMGELDEAQASCERARRAYRTLRGDKHTETAMVGLNLGAIALHRGRFEVAREELEDALAVFEETLGPHHTHVAAALSNLAYVEREVGDPELGLALGTRALRIYEQAYGARHPEVADVLTNVAALQNALGVSEGAAHRARRAIDIYAESYGPDHPLVASSLTNLGLYELAEGNADAAAAALRRAVTILEAAQGSRAEGLASALANLGSVEIARKNPEEALTALLAAQQLRAEIEVSPQTRGDTAFDVARAHWLRGHRQPAHAAALAAIRDFEKAGARYEGDVTRVKAWLDTHGWRASPAPPQSFSR